MALTSEAIKQHLKGIRDPLTGEDLISSGMVSAIVQKEGDVGFALELRGHTMNQAENLRQACITQLKTQTEIKHVSIALTGQPPVMLKKEKENSGQPEVSITKKIPLPGITSIIAVGAGKGGVGKSTATVLLAAACAKQGLRVGIVDADIYGPSIPKMLGLTEQHKVEGNQLVPSHVNGMYVVSIGLLLPEDSATIWRGPMVIKALHQLMRLTKWPDLDVLFIDLPPGTGDVPLHLSQNYPIDGVILVSTPSEVAVLDVKKAASMFQKLDVPILGLIENMAYVELPNQEKLYVFGEGGAQNWAARESIPLLASIPLLVPVTQAADTGHLADCDDLLTNNGFLFGSIIKLKS